MLLNKHVSKFSDTDYGTKYQRPPSTQLTILFVHSEQALSSDHIFIR